MAKRKENKISVTKLEQSLEDNIVVVSYKDMPDVAIEVKKTIGLSSMLEFVEEVVSAVMADGDTDYNPEFLEFLIKKNVLTRYANFTMPSNIEKQYVLVYGTPAYSQVIELINMEQLYDIRGSIVSRINHNKASAQADIKIEMNRALSNLVEFVDQVQNYSEDFKDIDMGKFVTKINSFENIDEEKLIKSLVEETARADK